MVLPSKRSSCGHLRLSKKLGNTFTRTLRAARGTTSREIDAPRARSLVAPLRTVEFGESWSQPSDILSWPGAGPRARALAAVALVKLLLPLT